jgi:hypothetical protein
MSAQSRFKLLRGLLANGEFEGELADLEKAFDRLEYAAAHPLLDRISARLSGMVGSHG